MLVAWGESFPTSLGFLFFCLFLKYQPQSHLGLQRIASFLGKWWIQGLDAKIRSSIHPFLIPAQGLRGLLEPLTAAMWQRWGDTLDLSAVPHEAYIRTTTTK